MANIPEELLAQDEDLSPTHAVKAGAHEGVATLVKYGTVAATLAIISYVFLGKKMREQLKRRLLG
ncbi:MAG: hypothetical protein ACYTEQ_19865 [Planctomycetota bacterium]|jgi:hypothetical protein